MDQFGFENLYHIERKRLINILLHYKQYPSEHRKTIWKILLNLPCSKKSFDNLINKPRHPSVEQLKNDLFIFNSRAVIQFGEIMSCLFHWCPGLIGVKSVPVFVHPFVVMFKNDQMICFETVITILANYYEGWFIHYPLPPLSILNLIENTLVSVDKPLMRHFYKYNVTAETYSWSLLKSAFSEVLSSEEWKVLWDHILSNGRKFFVLAAVAYNCVQRNKLMRLSSLEDFKLFFISQNQSQTTKKTTSVNKALEHFDDFYASVFGTQWKYIRMALLRNHKYVAVVNNYSDVKETVDFLQRIGAHDIKTFFDAHKMINETVDGSTDSKDSHKLEHLVKEFAKEANMAELGELYKTSDAAPESMNMGEIILGSQESANIPNKNEEFVLSDKSALSLASSLSEAEMDESRIIDPELGLSANELWTFVPATKLKGRDDWLPESHYFNYYKSKRDFPLEIENDTNLQFPEHLKVYMFQDGERSLFPEPRKGSTGVLNYYLMDGASILPILALDLKNGDRILDVCAAPGGKSLAALQTLMPDILVCNDSSISRNNRLRNVLKEYLYDYETSNAWRERIFIENVDGREFKSQSKFDKIMVDVPCTTDRHTVKENDNNIFSTLRIKERLRIPELQSALLCNALTLCNVGGCVVYSTCSLSPIQNDGVVHMSLKKVWEELGIQVTIKLLDNFLDHLTPLYRFETGQAKPKYGSLVIPHIYSNFGPLYLAKLVRTK